MKNLTKLWSLALLLTASMFMVSCEKDEPTIEVDEGLALSDGYYFAIDGEDPSQNTRLQPELVEGEEFAAVEREGFFGNYVFLTAGDYNLVSVVAKEITSTLGGSLTEIPGAELTGDEVATGYDLAIMEEDGAKINIANDGFFKISYDETTSELIVMEVETVSILGSATANGWTDTELNIIYSSPEEGLMLEKTGMILSNGEFKIRINNGWKIVRTNEAGNGYIPFTNYGGTIESLVAGGGNILFEQGSGEYTVEVTLTNDGGASLSFTKTGEGPTFNPQENNWAVVGAATDLGWPANNDCGAPDQDIDMTYDGEVNGAYTWSVELNLATDQFKFRTNDCWNTNLNYTQVEVIGPDAANITNAGGNDNNFLNNVAGRYNIVLSTANDGESYSVSFELLEATGTDPLDPTTNQWAVVGAATELGWPAGDCGVEGEDVDMTYDGVVNGAHTWSVTLPLTADEFKWRKNDCWNDGELNFSNTTMTGPNADNFSNPENGNVKCDVAGTYAIVLTTSDEGVSYTAEFTLQ